MVYQFFVEVTQLIPYFRKENNPPTQLCAFITPYSNPKLLKIPNNLITLEYP
jgi:hypothetical protein